MLHLIQTRFNVGAASRLPAHGVSCEDWWKVRFPIFEHICYPSMLNQTNQDFLWIILLDRNTPPRHFMQLRALVKPTHFVVTFQRGNEWSFGRRLLKEFVPRTVDFVISTVLDNDDMYCLDFVDRVQRKFRTLENPDDCLIDMSDIVYLSMNGKWIRELSIRQLASRRPIYASSMASAVESTQKVDYLSSRPTRHDRMRPLFKRYEMIENYAAQIVGCHNLVNTLGRSRPLTEQDWVKLKRLFGDDVTQRFANLL